MFSSVPASRESGRCCACRLPPPLNPGSGPLKRWWRRGGRYPLARTSKEPSGPCLACPPPPGQAYVSYHRPLSPVNATHAFFSFPGSWEILRIRANKAHGSVELFPLSLSLAASGTAPRSCLVSGIEVQS